MKLMTEKIKEKLLQADRYIDAHPNEPLTKQQVHVKYFHPGRFTFYAISAEDYGDDLILFGWCLSLLTPDFDEYVYISLSELESIPLMERDLYTSLGKLGEYITKDIC